MRWRDIKQGKKDTPKEAKNTIPLHLPVPVFDRVKAFITDTFMIMMPLMYFVFYIVMGSREEFGENMLLGWAYIFIPHFVITVGFWKIKGQTPGYKAYNIKITTTDGKRPNIFQLIVRYITFTIILMSFIPLLFCFLLKDRRGIYDIVSNTIPSKM